MANKPKIQIIVGSTRENRMGKKIADWIYELASSKNVFDLELVDLQEWNLPMFNEPISPAYAESYVDKTAEKFAAKIAEADGYIMVTPEYNHSFPASLKNAIDFVYKEWNRKAVAFVGYSGGNSGAIRAIEQLRGVAVELQMASVKHEVNIPAIWSQFNEDGTFKGENFTQTAEALIDNLNWWASALKEGRSLEKNNK